MLGWLHRRLCYYCWQRDNAFTALWCYGHTCKMPHLRQHTLGETSGTNVLWQRIYRLISTYVKKRFQVYIHMREGVHSRSYTIMFTLSRHSQANRSTLGFPASKCHRSSRFPGSLLPVTPRLRVRSHTITLQLSDRFRKSAFVSYSIITAAQVMIQAFKFQLL